MKERVLHSTEDVGQVFRTAVSATGLSYQAIADKAGVHQATLWNVTNQRNPKRGPSIGMLISIADALGYQLVLRRKEESAPKKAPAYDFWEDPEGCWK
ncbi:MAG: helix-turn-helix transcriptional regulator [Clostridia bacterium]|nr:helix-turn-helix transcriptional regulator [Clostridia bacterium]